MNFASLPMILYVLPLVMIAAAIVPPQRKPDVLALGGLAAVWMTGSFPALILLLISVSGTWLLMRIQPQRAAEHRKLWLYAGAVLQLLLLALGRWMLTDMQLIPLLVCTMQNAECMAECAAGRFQIPGLYSFFCYQCDLTRLPAGPVLRYADVEALRAQRSVSAERIGRGASRCIRGLFQLVCLGLPMYTLQTGMRKGSAVHTAADAMLSALSFYFCLYFALNGTARIGQGIADMLGYSVPDHFDKPILADSVQDFRRRFLRSVAEWTDRVLLPESGGRDAAGYFSRMALLLSGIGFLLCKGSGGIIWGVLAAAVLTAEHFRPQMLRSVPIQARRLLTAVLVLLSMGLLCSDSLFDCFSFYAALIGVNGIALSDTAGYLLRTNWLAFLLCAAGIFPLRRLQPQKPGNFMIRFLLLCCKTAAELLMLLAAYSELLSTYLRS